MIYEHPLFEVVQSPTRKFVVTKIDFHGRPRIDIRLFHHEGGEWKPGGGIWLAPEILDQVIDGLEQSRGGK